MQPDLLDSHVLHQFRTRSPLTHCMTNDVVQTFTANVLLRAGCFPGNGDRSRGSGTVCRACRCPAHQRGYTHRAARPVDASGH